MAGDIALIFRQGMGVALFEQMGTCTELLEGADGFQSDKLLTARRIHCRPLAQDFSDTVLLGRYHLAQTQIFRRGMAG